MIFPRQRLQCGASTALPSAGRFYQLLNARISFSGFLHFLSFFFFFQFVLTNFLFFCHALWHEGLSSPTRGGTQPLAVEGRALTTGSPRKSLSGFLF